MATDFAVFLHRFLTANAWLASQQTGTGRGTWVDTSLGKELFGDYSRKWLDTRSYLAEAARAKYGYGLGAATVAARKTPVGGCSERGGGLYLATREDIDFATREDSPTAMCTVGTLLPLT